MSRMMIVGAACMLLVGRVSIATTSTWDDEGGGNWLNEAHWVNGIPDGLGDVANFGMLAPGANATITLDGPVIISGLESNSPHVLTLDGVSAVTFDAVAQGGQATLDLGSGAGEFRWNVPIELAPDDELAISIADPSSRLVFNSAWSNTLQAVTMAGQGELSLRTDNALWDGTLTVQSGKVDIQEPIGGTLDVLDGYVGLEDRFSTARVNLSGGTVALTRFASLYSNPFHLSGGTLMGSDSQIAMTTISSTFTLEGGDSTVTGGRMNLIGGSTGAGHLTIKPLEDGAISVSGLNHNGSVRFTGGVTTLTGPSSYSGQTFIEDGEVILSTSSGLGDGTFSTLDGTTVGPGGVLTLHSGSSVRLVNELVNLAGGRLQYGEMGGLIQLAAGTDSVVEGTFIDGVIYGDGAITYDTPGIGSNVILRGNNLYTGRTTVVDGRVDADSVNALGTSDMGTVVQGGVLVLHYDNDEPITIEGGEVELRATTHDQPIEMSGGVLRTRMSNNNNVVTRVVEPVTLAGGGEATISSWAGGLLHLESGTTGEGDLVFGGNAVVFVDGPLVHAGDTTVQAVDVLFTAPGQELAGQLKLAHSFGGVTTSVDMTADVVLSSGRLTIEAGAVVTIPRDEWVIHSGAIDGTIAGPNVIAKEGPGGAFLADIGVDNEALIEIREGMLHFNRGEGMGSPAMGTIVTSTSGAVLSLNPGWTFADGIDLNNAHGVDRTGALIMDSSSSSPATLTGPLDLGVIGATIGVGNGGTINLEGPVSGGDLILNSLLGTSGSGQLYVAGADNSYTGETIIGVNPNRTVMLALREQGRLTTTSRVIVNHDGVFRLDQFEGAISLDRLADDIPVALRSGTLELTGSGFDTAEVSETVGTISLESGKNTLLISPYIANQVALTITQLDRQPGAVVEVLPAGLGEDLPQDPRIFITNAPSLDDGIIGAWATTSNSIGHGGRVDFVSYDPVVGVHALPLIGRADDLDTAVSTDNVWMDVPGSALTADRQVNSLVIDTSAVEFVDRLNPVNIDLGGHTLNIESGGLVRAGISDTEITGGVLTAGGTSAGSELIVRNPSVPIVISANITDNPGGAVGLTLAGQGTVDLSGVNTYTGPTVINEGSLRLATSTSIPSGSDVIVDGGSLSATTALGDVVSLGDIVIRNDGGIGGFEFTAETVTLEAGYFAGIRGEAPIRKIGPVITSLGGDNPLHTGGITIEEGGISVTNGRNDRHPLGAGVTMLMPDTKLLIAEQRTTLPNPIALAGGTIEVFRSPSTRPAGITGGVEVVNDSHLEIDGSFKLAGNVSGSGDLYVGRADALSLLVIDGDNSDFSGDWIVDDLFINLGHRQAIGSGALRMNGGKVIAGVFPLDGALTLSNTLIESDNGSGVGQFNGPIEVVGGLTTQGEQPIWHNGQVSLADGVVLTNQTTLDWLFLGDVEIGGTTHVVTENGPIKFMGAIRTTGANTAIHKSGPEAWSLAASLEIGEGHELSIYEGDVLIPLEIRLPQQTVLGDGTLINDTVVASGGAIAPGQSIGALSFAGSLTLDANGVYEWELQSASAASAEGNWDMIHVATLSTSQEAAQDAFEIHIRGLSAEGEHGRVVDFDPFEDYAWPIAVSEDTSGVDLSAIAIDSGEFLEHHIVPPDGQFSLQLDDDVLSLIYIGAVFVPGDLDGSGVLDAFDVSVFEMAISDPEVYGEMYPGLDPNRLGDFDGNGLLDAFDVRGFEMALADAGASVPEPGGLLGLGVLGLLLNLNRRVGRRVL